MGKTADALAWATQLTREGRLAEATQVIQQALGRGEERQHGAPQPEPPLEPSGDDGVVDVPFREITSAVPLPEAPVRHAPQPRASSFTAHIFAHGGHRWRYRLFEPVRPDASVLLPVVVMLHGCKQDSEDFARGTRMNEVAARDGFLVLYPEQLRKANQMGCWNWFDPGHQKRGSGEPAMIAALVQDVVARHGGDPHRVYVAGLSAGGAMSATLGDLYPEIFAAVGIHSGLPPRAAHDVQSAFSAMRKGSAAPARPAHSLLPTVVFHGSGDRTVAPANGEAVVQRQVAAAAANGMRLERREERVTATRSAKRTAWVDDSGRRVIESWQVATGPHAWSGGDAAGSFTDPQGPNASEAMAAFFLRHRRAG